MHSIINTITINGREISVRGLTRAEIRDLKDLGYHYMGVDRPTLENGDEWLDRCLEKVLPPEDMAFLDTCQMRDSMTVWRGIFRETYGAVDEEKNLSSTSDGTETGSE